MESRETLIRRDHCYIFILFDDLQRHFREQISKTPAIKNSSDKISGWMRIIFRSQSTTNSKSIAMYLLSFISSRKTISVSAWVFLVNIYWLADSETIRRCLKCIYLSRIDTNRQCHYNGTRLYCVMIGSCAEQVAARAKAFCNIKTFTMD